MKILCPNSDEKIVQIPKYNVYIRVTDYGAKYILKEIVLALGHHTWQWIRISETEPIDVSGIGDRCSSFENSINKAINDAYSTIYQFENYDELFMNWKSIKYKSEIKTKYEGTK